MSRIVGVPLLAAVVLGLSATSVLAAPQLGVTLERDQAEFPVVHHSDERVDFTVKVKNVAAKTETVTPGTVLTCDQNETKWLNEPIFTFKWLSSGVEVGTGATYEAQPSDAGHSLQCLVTGENAGGSSVAATLPLPVAPVPSPEPAAYAGPDQPRPLIGESPPASAGNEITCTAPTSWTGSPSWTFEWLLDGGSPNGEVTATTATTSTYKVDAADIPGMLQCVAIARTGSGEAPTGGTVVSVSPPQATSPAPNPFPPFDNAFQTPYSAWMPFIVDPSATAGKVTVELELPGGEETFAFKTEQEPATVMWSCEMAPAFGAQHARAVCSREDPLPPQEEYAPLKVITALGADVPDIATAKATVFGGGAGVVSDELSFPIAPAIPFGLSKFTARLVDESGLEYRQAGGHPFKGESEVVFNQKRALVPPDPTKSLYIPVAQARQVIADVPRGVVGNALALPELCAGVEAVREEKCPSGSVIGGILIRLSDVEVIPEPIYAIKPEFGTPAQFAFRDPLQNTYTFSPRLRAGDGYAVSLELAPAVEADVLESTVTLCDFGGSKSGSQFAGCKEKNEPNANPKPLFTNPTRCGVPLTTRVRLNSWSDPAFIEGPPFANAEITGCDAVSFEPTADLEPTNRQADSPTGLDVEVGMPTDGLEDPDGISQSNLREAKVTFPQGMAINASAGQGLGACSADQIKLGTNEPIACPESSKVGTVEIETPVIEDALKGSVYIARQGEVEGSLIGFYLVFDSPKNGILVKLPAKVTPDPRTGQLTVTVAESPEQPFSAVRMHFPGGPRATLVTPPKCGTYQIVSELTPWSGGAPVTKTSSFEVNEGPNGGPCPTGALAAKMSAGTENPTAGRTSPFVMRLSREDGSQRFTALNLTTPPGLTAYLKGIPYCPDSVLAGISADIGTGQAQIDHPSCPAASQVGTVTAGAGAGSDPLFVDTGRAYLAGPYRGAPLSLAVVAPAVAGPLDLGTVVVRNALFLNPETAQVTVESDPIPTILHGILLDVRDIRIAVDRSHFILNPTSCEPMSVGAGVTGESGGSVSLSNRFQVGGCDRLSFKPKLDIRLSGGTRRGYHPKLRGVLEAGPGEANIDRAAVTVPRSEFLDQAHIRTICTRVQFAADACPKGSVYGYATATTPLLDYPVTGPVYLRSSNHKLPDLVVDLHGPDWQPIEATVVGRIDSIKGQIRTTFEDAPDVPLTKFVLSMRGGKKGLLVNSRDICATTNRATVNLTAHNAAEFGTRPAVKDGNCNKERKARRKRSKRTRGP